MKTPAAPTVTVRKTRSVSNPRQWIYEFMKSGVVHASVVGVGGGVFRVLDSYGFREKTAAFSADFSRREAMLKAYTIAEGAP